MYCTKKITDDLTWVGANDRRLAMFEGVYSVPYGVSYNSYLLNDEKTVLIDTVDKAVRSRFMENLAHALGGRKLDYLVVQHMEPDHSVVIADLTALYPDMKVVCSSKTLAFIKQFYEFDIDSRAHLIGEGDTLNTGRHELQFLMAPMVHWPEVFVTYDRTDKALFSADAFGCFGALNGAIFADEVDFAADYMDEARRYYTNIVGKYGNQTAALLEKTSALAVEMNGNQTAALLEKTSALAVEMICPLHGFVWRKNIQSLISKYQMWSSYAPEENGVMIAYASVYGNTENTAELLASKLRDRGIKTVMFDVSVVPASEIVAASFRWSHLVFASTTYNAGIFVTMEAFISDLVAHNIQNRTVAIIENGSWAATSGKLIRAKLEECKNITFIENTVSLKSSLKTPQLAELDKMADALCASYALGASYALCASGLQPAVPPVPNAAVSPAPAAPAGVDMKTMFKLSYGLFVLTAKDGDKDNGCIINTVTQITEKPLRISIAVNKANLTHDMIVKTKEFNVSVLSESAPFGIFEQFGFHSGRDTDKFTASNYNDRTANNIRYVPEHTNGIISAKVAQTVDFETHTLFIADVVQAFAPSAEPSATYQYYFNNIKPKPQPAKEKKKGFVCQICGYVHEGDTLPPDFICPLCKHGAADFEPL